MNDQDKSALLNFLGKESNPCTPVVVFFLDRLLFHLDFTIKIQNASIQLVHEVAFAALGFRKKKNLVFIEFYSDDEIKDNRIAAKYNKSDLMIIHTLNISALSNVDDQLMRWIIKSHELSRTNGSFDAKKIVHYNEIYVAKPRASLVGTISINNPI
jgi:hypothetical protein